MGRAPRSLVGQWVERALGLLRLRSGLLQERRRAGWFSHGPQRLFFGRDGGPTVALTRARLVDLLQKIHVNGLLTPHFLKKSNGAGTTRGFKQHLPSEAWLIDV